MLTHGPPLTRTVTSSLLMHVHSNPLSLLLKSHKAKGVDIILLQGVSKKLEIIIQPTIWNLCRGASWERKIFKNSRENKSYKKRIQGIWGEYRLPITSQKISKEDLLSLSWAKSWGKSSICKQKKHHM